MIQWEPGTCDPDTPGLRISAVYEEDSVKRNVALSMNIRETYMHFESCYIEEKCMFENGIISNLISFS